MDLLRLYGQGHPEEGAGKPSLTTERMHSKIMFFFNSRVNILNVISYTCKMCCHRGLSYSVVSKSLMCLSSPPLDLYDAIQNANHAPSHACC